MQGQKQARLVKQEVRFAGPQVKLEEAKQIPAPEFVTGKAGRFVDENNKYYEFLR